MIHIIVALYDKKAVAFGTPVFVKSTGEAIRSVSDVVNSDSKDTLAKHPEDFALWQLGEFDDSTGSFNTDALQNEHLVDVLSLVQNNEAASIERQNQL